MAKTTALSKIIREAKAIRKRHPNKYKSKSNPWAHGYMTEASKKYNAGTIGKKKRAVSKKKKAKPAKVHRKKITHRAKPVKHKTHTAKKQVTKKRGKRKVGTKKPVKVVTRRSVERTVGRKGGRRVGKKDNTMLILGIGALALGAFYLMKPKTPTYPTGTIPNLSLTNNTTRNSQSQDILNYAMAGGLALDAIAKLIDSLNTSSDNQVDSYYKQLNTTGQLDQGLWA